MRTSRSVGAWIASLILVTIAGCAASPSPGIPGSSTELPGTNQSMECPLCDLSQAIGYDYVEYLTLSSLRDACDLAAVARIVSASEGRTIGAGPDPMRQVVVGLEVETALGHTSRGATIQLELPVPPTTPMDEFIKSVPIGTRAVLFAADYTVPKDTPVFNDGRGRPDGSTLYAPQAQGLFLEEPDGTLRSVLVGNDSQPDRIRNLRTVDDMLQELGA